MDLQTSLNPMTESDLVNLRCARDAQVQHAYQSHLMACIANQLPIGGATYEQIKEAVQYAMNHGQYELIRKSGT